MKKHNSSINFHRRNMSKNYFKKIEKDQIISKIGEGLEAKIYKIKSYFDIKFAVKILKFDQYNNYNEKALKNAEDEFLEEYQINKFIQKNNANYITPVCDLIKLNNNIGYIMPLADCALDDYVKLGNIKDELDLFNIANNISLGVKAIHKNNFIHKDLKPNNILMFGDNPKICDFGFASHVDRKVKLGGYLGYLPPENEDNIYGFKTDIWALGLIFYFIKYKNHLFRITANQKIADLKEEIFNFKEKKELKELKNEGFDLIIKSLIVNLEDRCYIDTVLEMLNQNIKKINKNNRKNILKFNFSLNK